MNIIAHSQGNIVASEAILQGAPFDDYILTQGAIPAQCYDVNAPFLQKFLNAETNKPTPLAVADGGYHGYFTNLTGNLINFYNTNDYALRSGTWGVFDANWEKNQVSQKPEIFGENYYHYDGTNCLLTYFNGAFTETVTDSYEKKAVVARSRTQAIGAFNFGGVLNTINSVDLKAQFDFGESREEHSAQFTRKIQTVWEYYDQVLSSFRIEHIQR